MKRLYYTLLVAAGLVVSTDAESHADAQDRRSSQNASGTHRAYTPPKGDPERNAIMDALRQMLQEDKKNLVFVVDYLKVKDGWAWLKPNPQSPDGKTHLEPVWSLLRRQGGQWKVVYVRPCCADCAEDPDCVDDKRLYKKLKRDFPDAPAEIFP
jgi:hypothetical protein